MDLVMVSKGLSPNWVNVILQITSRLQKAKSNLLSSEGAATYRLLGTIIVWELIFLFVSIPLYLVSRSAAVPGLDARQYRVRRVISLTTVAVITFLWVIKLGFIGLRLIVYENGNTLTIQKTEDTQEIGDLEQQILGIQTLTLDAAIASPQINSVKVLVPGNLEIRGTAPADSKVVMYITKKEYEESSFSTESTVAVAAVTDSQGNFAAVPNTAQFTLNPGEYRLRAVALGTDNTYSPSGTPVGFSLSETDWGGQRVLQSADKWINWTVVLFLLFGLSMNVLLT